MDVVIKAWHGIRREEINWQPDVEEWFTSLIIKKETSSLCAAKLHGCLCDLRKHMPAACHKLSVIELCAQTDKGAQAYTEGA